MDIGVVIFVVVLKKGGEASPILVQGLMSISPVTDKVSASLALSIFKSMLIVTPCS